MRVTLAKNGPGYSGRKTELLSPAEKGPLHWRDVTLCFLSRQHEMQAASSYSEVNTCEINSVPRAQIRHKWGESKGTTVLPTAQSDIFNPRLGAFKFYPSFGMGEYVWEGH